LLQDQYRWSNGTVKDQLDAPDVRQEEEPSRHGPEPGAYATATTSKLQGNHGDDGDQSSTILPPAYTATMQFKMDWSNRTRPSIHYENFIPFEKQDGVVIVTKIHGTHQLHLLNQALCLLHYAYNRRPQYDIVVFTTDPISEGDMDNLRTLIHPVHVSFVVDNRGLQEEIAALSLVRYQNFLRACKVDNPHNLTWWSECPGRIAYNWQAEFRSWHIWKHPALAPYQFMIWLDSDSFCTREWTVDPIQVMIENDLVILFDNWPEGTHGGADVKQRIWNAFGVNICTLQLEDGHFVSELRSTACRGGPVGDIHGFFHITNLDFYRSDFVQKWAEIWIGDDFLQRRYDDQFAVTAPAAILAPEKAWDMRGNNIHLDVFHNFALDGKHREQVGGFLKYWRENAKDRFPDAVDVCPIKATG
jgi:hypothetical protein